MKPSPKQLFSFVGSTGLSVILLLLLALLTLLGTLEQVDQGIYAVQKKYFESLFLVHDLFGFLPLPLPGVYLLLVLLSVNLFCGAILRAHKGWRQLGILIAHAGILVLLVGAFVSFKFSVRGQITLYEGERTNEFVSYDAWEIAVAPVSESGPVTEYLIPGPDFEHARGTNSVTFHADGLPFDLTVSRYSANTQPVPADSAPGMLDAIVDGFGLRSLEPERDPERNVPGVYVRVRDQEAGPVQEGILWGMSRFPWMVRAAGRDWTIDLRRRTRSLDSAPGTPNPFTLQLDTFTRELYPGTGIPKAFISEVTKIDGDVREQARISMNTPLRYRGFTFYQSSWGPPDAGPGDRLYSSLAVVRNPADKFPLYASCVICFGLLVHFCQKLVGYLRAESRRRS